MITLPSFIPAVEARVHRDFSSSAGVASFVRLTLPISLPVAA